ncbi:hypothetical protein JOQ06_005854, partial [Pogonophryne albipinna]
MDGLAILLHSPLHPATKMPGLLLLLWEKNLALYSSSGDSPCGAAVLTDSEQTDTQRKSSNTENDSLYELHKLLTASIEQQLPIQGEDSHHAPPHPPHWPELLMTGCQPPCKMQILW